MAAIGADNTARGTLSYTADCQETCVTISRSVSGFPPMAPPAPLDSATLEDRLLTVLRRSESVVVALSAGVDSTLVAAAAQRALGARAAAVTAVSSSLPAGEREAAIELARLIGIRHQLVETRELDRPDYARNPINRCYFCKTELYESLKRLAPDLGITRLANGANLDDQGDYRPGMDAAREAAVWSPLIEAGFGKAEVRQLARHWGLPNWDKPAGPCLSSRIAYGVEVTPERLARIDAAEGWLRKTLGVRELRVRLEANDLARVELPPPALTQALAEPCRANLVAELKRLGFRYVTLDLEGFRSGSLNAVVPLRLPSPPT
jgi:uncharacterized protein